MDFKQYDHLFYALVDGNAAIVTPPMIFATGAADEALDPDQLCLARQRPLLRGLGCIFAGFGPLMTAS
jgi:hypothetical protein